MILIQEKKQKLYVASMTKLQEHNKTIFPKPPVSWNDSIQRGEFDPKRSKASLENAMNKIQQVVDKKRQDIKKLQDQLPDAEKNLRESRRSTCYNKIAALWEFKPFTVLIEADNAVATYACGGGANATGDAFERKIVEIVQSGEMRDLLVQLYEKNLVPKGTCFKDLTFERGVCFGKYEIDLVVYHDGKIVAVCEMKLNPFDLSKALEQTSRSSNWVKSLKDSVTPLRIIFLADFNGEQRLPYGSAVEYQIAQWLFGSDCSDDVYAASKINELILATHKVHNDQSLDNNLIMCVQL